jgi:AcrR family transcriptional regulator
MTERVKPRRRYESARRAAQAEQTRRDIVTAAGLLFRKRGYGVPMAEIAGEAGVVVETVYRIFGTKAALFRTAVEALLAGGARRAEVPVAERPAIRAIHDEPDPRRQVAAYAATQPGIHRRAGPLLRALRDAKASDAELERLWDEMEARRLDGQGQFVRMLATAEPSSRASPSTPGST